jgi:hypothetical protein
LVGGDAPACRDVSKIARDHKRCHCRHYRAAEQPRDVIVLAHPDGVDEADKIRQRDPGAHEGSPASADAVARAQMSEGVCRQRNGWLSDFRAPRFLIHQGLALCVLRHVADIVLCERHRLQPSSLVSDLLEPIALKTQDNMSGDYYVVLTTFMDTYHCMAIG